jgi:hypothetical protein
MVWPAQLKFTSPGPKHEQAEPGQNLKEGGMPVSKESEEPVPKSDLYTNPAMEALIKRDTDADDIVCDEKLNMLSFEHLLELSEHIRVSVTMILRPARTYSRL